MRRRRTLIPLFLALGLGLTACSSGSATEESTESATSADATEDSAAESTEDTGDGDGATSDAFPLT